MPFIRKSLPLLLLFFLASVAIRLPNINRPLSKHHEFCTAVSLRVLQIWYEHGASTYHYNPVMTYGNPADRYINNYASGSGQMVDAQGNYYYVSHPPLGYYVPYAWFKLWGIYPTVSAIQYFHLFFHFLCALGVYFMVCVLYGRPLFGGPFFGSVAAFTLYLFNPVTMWFQCNTYMADMAVQVPFVFGLLAALLARRDGYKKAWLLPLCLLVFVMVYTSWLGVFFTVVLAAYLFFWGIRDSRRWWWAGAVKLSMLAALLLIVFQYSRINGFHAYFAEATQRAGERSIHSIAALPGMYFTIVKNHTFDFLTLFIAVGILVVLNRKNIRTILQPFKVFIALSALPIFLLHLILVDYSAHDFVALYAAPFWVVLAVVLFQENDTYYKYGRATVAILTIVFVAHYFIINRPGTISLSGDRYDTDMRIGNIIAAQSRQHETVFIIGPKLSPQAIFYAHRNIEPVADLERAKEFVRLHHCTGMAIFEIDPDSHLPVRLFDEVSRTASLY